MDLRGATIGTVGNGTWNPLDLAIDEHFWRVVGLYIAEGHCTAGRAARSSGRSIRA